MTRTTKYQQLRSAVETGVELSRGSSSPDGVFHSHLLLFPLHFLLAFLEAIMDDVGSKTLDLTLVNPEQTELLGWALEMNDFLGALQEEMEQLPA